MAEEKGKIFEVRITNDAFKNIEEIGSYIAFVNHQPLNAAKVADAIFTTIDRIAANPFVFQEYEVLATKKKLYRRAVCHSWLIIYKIYHDYIEVVGVFHKSVQPSRIKVLRKINK